MRLRDSSKVIQIQIGYLTFRFREEKSKGTSVKQHKFWPPCWYPGHNSLSVSWPPVVKRTNWLYSLHSLACSLASLYWRPSDALPWKALIVLSCSPQALYLLIFALSRPISVIRSWHSLLEWGSTIWTSRKYSLYPQGISEVDCSVLCCSVVSDSLQPYGLYLASSSIHGDSPCKNTGVGCW